MAYTGTIVLQPPDALTYEGEPRTRAQQLELTRAQTDVLLQRLVGRPMHTEHDPSVPVGRVTRAFYDAQGNACVSFELAGRPAVVDSTRRLIADGWLRGLSLSHHRDTLEPTEVSLCFNGARAGTGLTHWPGSDQRESRNCKPLAPASLSSAETQQGAFVCASATMSQAPLLSTPMYQLGQPPPGQVSAHPNVTTQMTSAGGAMGPARSLNSLITPQEQQQQEGNAHKRRRVTLADGTQVELTDEELQQLQQKQVQATGALPLAAAAPTAPGPQQQQQQQPPAPAAAAAGGEPGAKLTPEQTREQILRRMVENKGAMSEEDQVSLIEAFTRHRKDREALVGQVTRLEKKLQDTQATETDQTSYLLKVLVPFLRTFLGKQAVTPEQETQLSRQLLDGQSAAQFMRSVGPQLVQASSLAMELKRREEESARARVPPRLQQALAMLDRSHAELEAEDLAPPPSAQPFVPQQQQFASQQWGWQPNPATLVSASGLSGGSAPNPFAALEQLSGSVGSSVPMQLRMQDVMDRNKHGPPDPNAGFAPTGMLPRRM